MAATRATHTKLNPTRNNLPEETRSQVSDLLNRLLASGIDLQTQVKQAHWNVKGPNFIGLHKLFDKVHGSVTEYVDMMAERIVQLGGTAEGTARVAAERSELTEYPINILSGEEHVKNLSLALATFGSKIRFAIEEADELDDADTMDLFTEISRGTDKWLWMVEAHGQAKN
jgi:starvation-inducible DNA-binding protein